MQTFEAYVQELPDHWIHDQGYRAYPLALLTEDGPARLQSRSSLYARMKKLGLEAVMYRVNGVMVSHLTEHQIALLWSDVNPNLPRPLVLDQDPGPIAPAPDLGRMLVQTSPETLVQTEPDTIPVEIRTEVLADLRLEVEQRQADIRLRQLAFEEATQVVQQQLERRRLLAELADTDIQFSTPEMAAFLGVSSNLLLSAARQSMDSVCYGYRTHGYWLWGYRSGTRWFWTVHTEPEPTEYDGTRIGRGEF